MQKKDNEDQLLDARLVLSMAGGTMTEARRIRDFLGDEQALLTSDAKTLQMAGLRHRMAERLFSLVKNKSHLEEMAHLAALEGRLVLYGGEDYPTRLLKIPHAPPVLYLRGCLALKNTPVLAVVGSRACTPEGQRLARWMGAEMAARQIVVVSGLARGIDTAAMAGCLENNGQVMGVLGCGIDRIYPQENAGLFLETMRAGGLISEYPLATPPLKKNFPRRNRIISGLADGLLVVEASRKSGSLLTVDHALAQSRVVMAMPGPVKRPQFMGSNTLIRDGACVVLEVEDVLAALYITDARSDRAKLPKKTSPAMGPAAALLKACSFRSLTLEALARETALPLDRVVSLVSEMELQGLVLRVPGARFIGKESLESNGIR